MLNACEPDPNAHTIHRYSEVTGSGTAQYTTVGALVPVLDVQRAVAGAARWKWRHTGQWDRKAVRG